MSVVMKQISEVYSTKPGHKWTFTSATGITIICHLEDKLKSLSLKTLVLLVLVLLFQTTHVPAAHVRRLSDQDTLKTPVVSDSIRVIRTAEQGGNGENGGDKQTGTESNRPETEGTESIGVQESGDNSGRTTVGAKTMVTSPPLGKQNKPPRASFCSILKDCLKRGRGRSCLRIRNIIKRSKRNNRKPSRYI